MVLFRDETPPRRLTLKKILYHPLTLVALGIHIALILAPLNISRLPLISKLLIGLVLLLIGVLVGLSWLWRTGQLSQPGAFKKILYHPLTWIAVGFHLLLLTVPFSTEPSEVAEKEEAIAEEEAMPVDLLNLSEIATAEPPPPAAPPPAAPPPNTPPAAPPSATPPPEPSTSAAPPSAAPVASPQPVPNAPAPPPTQPQNQPSAQPQLPAYDPAADQKVFIKGLDSIASANLNEYGELPTADRFSKGNAQFFLGALALAADFRTPIRASEPGSLPDGAATAKYTDKQPQDVLGQIQSSFASVGVTFTPAGEYGQEPLYELKKPTGETFAFVSLVGFEGSTLTVVWTQNPNGSSGV